VFFRPSPPRRSRRDRRRTLATLAFAALLVVFSACRRPPPGAPQTRLEEPNPDSVESVVFLIGDAGEAVAGTSPVVARLHRDVEAWAGGLARDSAVAVIFLGDNVYPVGVRDPSDPFHAEDTLRLRAQIDVLGGPNARRFRTPGYFIAGNHDWGNMIGGSGLRRLANQQERIDAAREHGVAVRLVPAAGQPGPQVVDLGSALRVLFMDTHWWLQEPSARNRRQVLGAVEQAILTAGGRHVMIAAHHPFVSGGAHGGPMPIWEGLGILWLLRQTGSLVQDLNSVVYRELLSGLKQVFARVGPPLIFAGGHDHSLQVIADVEPDEPLWSLVSGAGSKVTEVTYVGGMQYADDAGGFMRLTFMRDGSVLLHVLAVPEEHVACASEGDGDLDPCMQDGVDAFQTVVAMRLH
jgi:hypothetical protein